MLSRELEDIGIPEARGATSKMPTILLYHFTKKLKSGLNRLIGGIIMIKGIYSIINGVHKTSIADLAVAGGAISRKQTRGHS